MLGTYLERHPGGEFAPIARALIEHYERQLKAEVAAREQERKRLEEEKKAAEVKRLEQERRARQAALAEERRRAEEAKNLAEAKVVEEKQRAEWQARTEELRMALEEAWLARGAAKAADMERTAAVKAAEEAGCRGFARHPASRGRRRQDDDRSDRGALRPEAAAACTDRTIQYGDPPNACPETCGGMGASMLSEPQRDLPRLHPGNRQ